MFAITSVPCTALCISPEELGQFLQSCGPRHGAPSCLWVGHGNEDIHCWQFLLLDSKMTLKPELRSRPHCGLWATLLLGLPEFNNNIDINLIDDKCFEFTNGWSRSRPFGTAPSAWQLINFIIWAMTTFIVVLTPSRKWSSARRPLISLALKYIINHIINLYKDLSLVLILELVRVSKTVFHPQIA